MDAYLERLYGQKAEAANRMKELVTRAEDETRDMTGDEGEQLAKFDADYERIAAEITKVESARDKLAATDNVLEAITREQAARRDTKPEVKSDTRLIADYFKSFRDGNRAELSFESTRTLSVKDATEERALGVSANVTVPASLVDMVTVYERTLNPVINVARVINTPDGSTMYLPRLTADVTAGGSLTAEAGAITEGDATLSAGTLAAYKIAHTQLWSAELDIDNIVGLQSLLADAVARPIGLGWGTYFTTGTGSSQPGGFIALGANGGTALGTAAGSTTDTFVSPADLVDLYFFLAAPYRTRGTWMFATTMYQKARKFRDSNKQFIWEPSLQAGVPDTFLGRPAYENPAMAAVASATKSVAFGDFDRYIVRDTPVRVDLSRDYKFNTDQLALRYITRRDGTLVDTAAIAYLVSANT